MIAALALTVAAAAIIGAVELGRLQFQRARTLARIRSLPAVPLPAGAAGPSVSHNPGVPRPSGPAAICKEVAPVRTWLADFLTKPPQTDACISWPYGANDRGYPQVRWAGRMQAVTRVVLTALVGPPPHGRRSHAAHAPVICHNPRCINPRHLRWATPAENTADQTFDQTLPRGIRNGQNKVTEATALAIYHANDRPSQIAAQFGVSTATVRDIKRGYTWKWLTSPTVAALPPAAATAGPADPNPGPSHVHAERGRPSPAGPGPRGGGPGQPHTARPAPSLPAGLAAPGGRP